MTARGRSLDGLRASPPSCTACSKPSSENTMPAGRARTIALNGSGWTKKPPAAVKLEPWKLEASRTMIVPTGMITFHHVSALLTRASQRTPMRLIAVKTNMSAIATGIPGPWRLVPLYQLWANFQDDAYWMAASTSMGATVAAWM